MSRPRFVLPSLLGYRVGTEHKASRGSSQPQGSALEDEGADSDPLGEHSYDSRKPGRDQRRLSGDSDTDREGRWVGRSPERNEDSKFTPRYDPATVPTPCSPGLLATCAPFHHCPHSGSPPPACQLQDRAQASSAHYQGQEQGPARSARAAGAIPGAREGKAAHRMGLDRHLRGAPDQAIPQGWELTALLPHGPLSGARPSTPAVTAHLLASQPVRPAPPNTGH